MSRSSSLFAPLFALLVIVASLAPHNHHPPSTQPQARVGFLRFAQASSEASPQAQTPPWMTRRSWRSRSTTPTSRVRDVRGDAHARHIRLHFMDIAATLSAKVHFRSLSEPSRRERAEQNSSTTCSTVQAPPQYFGRDVTLVRTARRRHAGKKHPARLLISTTARLAHQRESSGAYARSQVPELPETSRVRRLWTLRPRAA